jgi:hypothetical protein
MVRAAMETVVAGRRPPAHGRRMTHRQPRGVPALALTIALLAGACGTATVTPPPSTSPAAASPTWNPRTSEIDSYAAVWEAQQPKAYAYTASNNVDGMGGAAWHATHIDGRTEALTLAQGTMVGGEATPFLVEGTFDRVRRLIGEAGTIAYSADSQYGYLAKVRYEQPAGASDGSFDYEVTGFTTPGDRTAAESARKALDEALGRWAAYASPAWQYTWTRFAARDTPASATTYTVRHQDGRTVAVQADGTADVAPPPEATIEGTVSAAVAVVAGGGWVDVSADAATGLDLLIAVDPSPTATGDGYWIRVTVVDLAHDAARKALVAAQDRWSTAGPAKYSMSWTYDGCSQHSAKVTVKGDAATIKGRWQAACEADPVRPTVPDLFSAIGQALADNRSVTATYDKKLGYPVKVLFGPGADPAHTITISGFKRG